jgi:hypothetical protein
MIRIRKRPEEPGERISTERSQEIQKDGYAYKLHADGRIFRGCEASSL